MGSLERRLQRLEADRVTGEPTDGTPRHLERLFKALENLRRAEAGLEPLPYTEGDYADDLDMLENMIPAMRKEPGWQTEEAQETLDRWETDTSAQISEYERSTA